MAWGLARRGVAVLRYEKRTKAHAERLGGIAGFTVQDEVIADALSAVRLLRSRPDIDPNRLPFSDTAWAGHSPRESLKRTLNLPASSFWRVQPDDWRTR
ncbi:MAG: hypothetical protein WDM96_06940 [Lacunisphaera sp.]